MTLFFSIALAVIILVLGFLAGRSGPKTEPVPLIVLAVIILVIGFLGGRFGVKTEPVLSAHAPPSSPASTGPPPVNPEFLEPPASRARLSQENRLAALERLINRVGNADLATLEAMQRDLFNADKRGRETRIERQIVLYQIGVLGGPDSVREHFTADPDRSENQYGIVLEGWAHTDPGAALAWWSSLPSGNLRASLLAPLLQGFLGARGGTWEGIAPALGADELAKCALPLLESAIDKNGLAAALTFYEKHIGPEGWQVRSRVTANLSDRICSSRDPALLKRWFLLANGPNARLTNDQTIRVLRELGAADGANALAWIGMTMDENGASLDTPSNRMRISLGWAQARAAAAGQWLEAHPSNAAADAVAFQLAVTQVKAAPDKARHWAEFIGDSDLSGELEAIIRRYEK